MGVFGGNLVLECEKSQKSNQMRCLYKDTKEKVVAQVLGQVNKDGTVTPLKERGPMDLTRKLKEYMNDNVEITQKGSDEF